MSYWVGKTVLAPKGWGESRQGGTHAIGEHFIEGEVVAEADTGKYLILHVIVAESSNDFISVGAICYVPASLCV